MEEFATIAARKGTGLTSAPRGNRMMKIIIMETTTHVKSWAIEPWTAGMMRETKKKSHSGGNQDLGKVPKTPKNRSMLPWGMIQVQNSCWQE